MSRAYHGFLIPRRPGFRAENNALGVLDIESGQIADILPLGYKDHNLSKPQRNLGTLAGDERRDRMAWMRVSSDDAINIQNGGGDVPATMRSHPAKSTTKPPSQ